MENEMHEFVEQRKEVFLKNDIHCFVSNERGAFDAKPHHIIKAGTKGIICDTYTEGDDWEEQTNYYTIWFEDEKDSDFVEVTQLWDKYSPEPLKIERG